MGGICEQCAEIPKAQLKVKIQSSSVSQSNMLLELGPALRQPRIHTNDYRGYPDSIQRLLETAAIRALRI